MNFFCKYKKKEKLIKIKRVSKRLGKLENGKFLWNFNNPGILI